MISYSVFCTNSFSSRSGRSGCRSPYRRMRGGSPARKCRSEPFLLEHLLQVFVDDRHGVLSAAAGAPVVGPVTSSLGISAGVGDVLLERRAGRWRK